MKISKPRKWPENNVRQLRLAAGLTLEQLADKVEPTTSYDMIQKLELGARELRREWIERISNALGRPESDITIARSGEKLSSNVIDGKVMDSAREKLDSAIKMWFTENKPSTVQALAVACYEELFPEEKNNNIKSEDTEGLIFSCIWELQFKDRNLTLPEQAYIWWFSAKTVLFPKNKLRKRSLNLINVKNGGKIGDEGKIGFYNVFVKDADRA